jgi:hypothetical protein
LVKDAAIFVDAAWVFFVYMPFFFKEVPFSIKDASFFYSVAVVRNALPVARKTFL